MTKDKISESKEQSNEMLVVLDKLDDKEKQKALDIVTGMALVSELHREQKQKLKTS